MTWFYFKDTSLADENPLPGFRALHLETNHPLPDKITVTERKSLAPTLAKIKALLGNGLTGIDLVRVWLAWAGYFVEPPHRLDVRIYWRKE